MRLFHDTLSNTFTLETDENVLFLGPLTHALVKLQEFDLTVSQAREAVLRAIFNKGAEVDIDNVKRMASEESEFFVKNYE